MELLLRPNGAKNNCTSWPRQTKQRLVRKSTEWQRVVCASTKQQKNSSSFPLFIGWRLTIRFILTALWSIFVSVSTWKERSGKANGESCIQRVVHWPVLQALKIWCWHAASYSKHSIILTISAVHPRNKVDCASTTFFFLQFRAEILTEDMKCYTEPRSCSEISTFHVSFERTVVLSTFGHLFTIFKDCYLKKIVQIPQIWSCGKSWKNCAENFRAVFEIVI